MQEIGERDLQGYCEKREKDMVVGSEDLSNNENVNKWKEERGARNVKWNDKKNRTHFSTYMYCWKILKIQHGL